jgi:enoyl-CoA hydratase/carnithine racemase
MPPLRTLELRVEEQHGIATVLLNRPSAANALTHELLEELRATFEHLETLPSIRAVVLAGAGPRFCAGIDLRTLTELLASARGDCACEGRRRLALYKRIRSMQEAISSLERYPFPVVCAITGACVGGGIDLACAADIRFCSQDAAFCVKETDVGIVADLGTLQRLPALIGAGRAHELALTCRTFSGVDAERYGLVSAALPDAAATLRAARETAVALAAKSPLACAGTKAELLAASQPALAAGLEHVAWRNAATLVSADVDESLRAKAERRAPVYARL